MTSVPVSMSELRREGPWALRALGLSFGLADRATPLLLWTAAVHRDALAWLRAGETRIATSTALPGATRRRDPAGGWSIAAGGKCLIEVGPPAVDLGTADARRSGTGRVVVEGVLGLRFAGALCDLAVRRGLAVVAAYRSGSDEIVPERFAAAGWIAGLPTAGAALFLAGTPDDDPDEINAWLEHTPMARSAQARAALAVDLARVRAPGPDGYLGLSLAPPPASATGFSGADAAHLPITDWPQRERHAYRHGIEVEPADLRHLYALEERTWAPTSDRSRRQAAF